MACNMVELWQDLVDRPRARPTLCSLSWVDSWENQLMNLGFPCLKSRRPRQGCEDSAGFSLSPQKWQIMPLWIHESLNHTACARQPPAIPPSL
eukprot:1149337-Pelagomonas_calceolata.AAC.2